jgi:ribonuclease D
MMEPAEVLVDSPEKLLEVCAHLSSCPHFGFDTEFVGEDSYHPHLCLIQIACPEKLYLIDPLAIDSLEPFWNVVTNPAHEVIVHAGREEVRLCHLWSGQAPGNLFDLQIAAGLVGYTYPLGHGSLVTQVLGKNLSKGETLTEWRNRPLTRSQIRYAFDDVRFLLPAWERLTDQLQRRGRQEWAREEFARLLVLATPEEPGLAPGTERWRKLRGASTLDRRRLALLREVYAWRDQLAAKSNRPARTIVRDDLLIEIARRNPKSERDLAHVRGLAKKYLPDLIQVVQRGREVSLENCPSPAERDLDPPQVGWIANVMNAVLADFCIREGLASNLVASTQDLKQLVRARLLGMGPPEESFLTQGWRAQFVLPHLQAVLEGKRSIRIANAQADAPLAYHDVETISLPR